MTPGDPQAQFVACITDIGFEQNVNVQKYFLSISENDGQSHMLGKKVHQTTRDAGHLC